MKKGIHPEYKETKVTCACGNTFTVNSNKIIKQLTIRKISDIIKCVKNQIKFSTCRNYRW